MLVVRQEHRWWNRDPKFFGQGVVKELVVGRPPERVVNHDCSMQGRVLEIRPVKRNVLRYAVNDDVILLWLIHADPANLHEFGRQALDAHRIDLVDQRRRKRVFHPKYDRDFLHRYSFAGDWRWTMND